MHLFPGLVPLQSPAVWPHIRRTDLYDLVFVLHVVEPDSIGAGFTWSALSGLGHLNLPPSTNDACLGSTTSDLQLILTTIITLMLIAPPRPQRLRF
jgi:hypothetical protein